MKAKQRSNSIRAAIIAAVAIALWHVGSIDEQDQPSQ